MRSRWPLNGAGPTPAESITRIRLSFVSLGFRQLCARSGVARSMGSTGQCWDNAVAETFFATLKKELVYRRTWPTRCELETEIFEYIEGFYNRWRRHTMLGMLSPADYKATPNAEPLNRSKISQQQRLGNLERTC
jgi:transposase InsO family protein